MSIDMYGHAKKGVSEIKHFYWVQPNCFLTRRGYLSIENDLIDGNNLQR